jgi:uncharacterized OB-fold protein
LAEQVVFHPDILCIPEGGEKPYLIAYKCSCGSAWFPKLPFCPNCWSDKLEPMPLSRTGKLYTYTIVAIPQPGLQAPLAYGFVNFPEGVSVCAQIDVQGDLETIQKALHIDMDVEVAAGVIRKDKDGNETISYRFKPI